MNVFDREFQVNNLSAKVIAGVERLATIYKSLIQEQSVSSGLSPLQIQILTFICFQDKASCTTTKISEELCVTKGTVSDSIRVLINKKLIKKTQSNLDTRSFLFSITPEGKKEVKNLPANVSDLMGKLNTLDEEKLEKVWFGVAELLESLQSVKAIPSKMCYSCKHYKPLAVDGEFHCKLLKKDLRHSELRIDCKEHEIAA